MVLVQKPAYFELFFKQNRPENVFFYDILVRKNASLGFKNKKFKKWKNSHFSKGVNPCFWSKNGHCSNFFFQAIQARKMSFTIFQNKKTAFQFIKTRSSKSPKIDIFSKELTNRFGPKMAIFPSFFFFSLYRPGKCLLRYSIKKKHLFIV